MAKAAVTEFHILQILFFRQMIVFLSTLPAISRSFPQALKTQHPTLHVARLIGAFTATSCVIWAVAVLPLSTAITLGFAQVLFVTVLAIVFLKEKVGVHRMSALLIGFVGIVVVMRPGINGLLDIRGLIPLSGAAGAAVAVIAVRKLSQTESTATLLVYQSLFVGLLSAIPLFWLWTTPDGSGLLFLMALGLVATCGQWCGVRALRLAEASVIGNTKFIQLVYATLLGYVFFDETPDRYTLVGALLIVIACVYLVKRERMQRSKHPQH